MERKKRGVLHCCNVGRIGKYTSASATIAAGEQERDTGRAIVASHDKRWVGGKKQKNEAEKSSRQKGNKARTYSPQK